jgi:tricorn protease
VYARTLLCAVVMAVVCAAALAPAASAQTKPLRFPDIHGDQVVFSFAGDLWIASTGGGIPRRLTAHPGVEFFAKFSPDGKWIAFTGQYDGDEQVYVIPAEGGEPRQLTYYPARGPLPPRWGYDNQVYGWTPDGKSVVFRSMRDAGGAYETKLYTVPVEGGLPVALPMPDSGLGAFSPDGKRIFYSPLFRDFRTWKRYEGGWAQDLFIYDLASNSVEQITNHPRTDRDPMWIGDKLCFASDRDGTLNLYSYDLKTKQTAQLTRSKTYDARWPSSDERGQIVYEFGGELKVFDTRSGQDRKLAINVPDDGLHRRPARVSATGQIEDFELSPKGQRALFVARGDIFTVPIEKGPTRNLTNSSGAHDKWARWSPDGRKIAFLSDRSGEDEVWLANQDGSGQPEQLTTGGKAMRYAAEWAGDGKRLAFSDKDGKLYVLTLEDKKLVEIADEKRGQVRDYTWSADGGHLAFSLSNESGFRSIHIWSVEDGQVRRVTEPLFHTFNPAWDPEGNFLWYLSAREYAPQLGNAELDYIANRNTGIFAVALRKDVKHPFAPESDEVTLEEKKEEKPAEKKPEEAKKEEPKKEEAKKGYIKIDFDGITGRVAAVPISAENYGGLTAAKGFLVFVRGGDFFLGRQSAQRPALLAYNLKERKEVSVAENVQGYAISADGQKVLVRHAPQDFKLYDVPPKGPQATKNVSVAGLMVDRNPPEEWMQIFGEVWRRYRDFFYVANLHGYDWEALRQKYLPQVKEVGHRSDLNYVIGEMISELNVSHAYVEGGDFQIPPRPRVALPGARFELDRAAGRYRIAHIYRGHNEEERYRSPLTGIGMDVHVGDYVLAVDGQELKPNEDPYKLLRHKADRTVELTVNSKPSLEGARKVTYKPVTSEADLLYLDWVTANREKVDKMTNGRVGYLHIPDMGADGIREFIKYFYAQVKKEGLVVDVRSNGGGFVSQMIIERLNRKLLGTGFSRTNEDTETYPDTVFHGHLVCLLNETSASDGDIFPYMFRKAGLGPLIGKRSWGGVVGITSRGPLVDGGTIFVPEFGNANEKGEWDIEGHGVDPDIVVENDPKSVIAGRDPQLERGVEDVMKRIQASPKKLPGRPADPVKTK